MAMMMKTAFVLFLMLHGAICEVTPNPGINQCIFELNEIMDEEGGHIKVRRVSA